MPNQFTDDYTKRIGEISYTKNGTKATIIDYIDTKHCLVKFDDKYGYEYYTSYINFKNGQLTNPYECRGKDGVGFIGVGKYNSKTHKLAYYKWKAMLHRCYGRLRYSEESYEDCTVCEEWHNFQNFAEWFYNHWYDTHDEDLCVDKDILYHGNRVYCPERCCLVPLYINLMFIKERSRRGDLPIGVKRNFRNENKYIAIMSRNGVKYDMGVYDTPFDAYNKYKAEKEMHIKRTADEYKDIIPEYIYDALYKYEVQIDD